MSSNSYCANYCKPSPVHGCCFPSCCGPNAPCNEYNHICCPGGCPCPCLRPYGSTCYRPICKCCCPPPPKVPRPCPCRHARIPITITPAQAADLSSCQSYHQNPLHGSGYHQSVTLDLTFAVLHLNVQAFTLTFPLWEAVTPDLVDGFPKVNQETETTVPVQISLPLCSSSADVTKTIS
ncbi:unnamed protein product [Allacma fusca]|uniref:Uncharacterized protein n=1 Tax=Allacma fusca TaxID=39272 RepID=A0A8J2PEK6_9HEXA|nr:unnamed protein product [Allacma fusca]